MQGCASTCANIIGLRTEGETETISAKAKKGVISKFHK